MTDPTGPLDDIFFALSAPTRRDILSRLREGEATILQIAEPYPIALNTVSKHVKLLERAGLLLREVRGREHYCRLAPNGLGEAAAFLERYRPFWTERLGAMEKLLDDTRDEQEP